MDPFLYPIIEKEAKPLNCRCFLGRLLLSCAAAALILGQWMAAPVEAPASRNQPPRCSEPPCIPQALVHSDQDDGRGKILIVDKQRQTAFLWAKNGQWQEEARWPCSTGKAPGPKQVEGDQKTPEGIYFVLRNVPGRFLSDIYGSRALPLDYPNWMDRTAGRSGSAIWLHGTNKPLKPRDSNGCIVFNNRAIDDLAHRIRMQRTPVILVDALRWQPQAAAEEKADAVLPIISRWQRALMGGSYQRLKQWYAPQAAPSMAWWHRWCRLRNKSALKRGSWRSLARNRLLVQHGNQLVLLFDHYL
ncbi:MAG: L,D-transpeptidase, partial [Desulfosarcinaceae bacterium]